MMAFAVFGIKSSGLNLAVNLLIVFLVIIWLALVWWTYADARRRIADPVLVGCATAAALFPYVGAIVYAIVRPPEYLDDVRERDLEMQAAEARLAQSGYHLCPYCDTPVEKDFLRCPSCLRKLKDPCRVCGKPLVPGWKICPFCESEVGAAPTARRVRRRREPTPEPAAGLSDGQTTSRQAPIRSGVARQSPVRPPASGEPPAAPPYGRPQTSRP
jgi:hypothetical protein